MTDLTQSRLKEVLHYNPATGEFRWKVQLNGRVPAGNVGGCVDPRGYSMIKIDRRKYSAHRLAVLYVTGVLHPLVDHRDRDPSNNRFDNLRPATKSQNAGNGRWRTGASGFPGVTANSGRWVARLRINNRKTHLGMFDTPAEAHQAYLMAKRKHHGEFILKEWQG